VEHQTPIEDDVTKTGKQLLTGHRGCGKSTLLAELRLRLLETGRYFIVMFSIADTIEESAVDHVNILFSTAVELLQAAERQEVKLKPGLKRDLYRWLGKHTQTESEAVEAAIEATGEVGLKAGLLLEFLAKIKSTLKVNSVVRQEISTEFARKTSDLISRLNEIQAYLANATGQRILVIIDDLDKLDLSVTSTLFRDNIKPLLDPSFPILYTIPIATMQEVLVKRRIEDYVTKIHVMPVAKFFGREVVRLSDRIPDAGMMAIFLEVLDRRLPDELIEPGLREAIVLKSGGILRELIRIMDLCCAACLQELRRQIRKQQFDQPEVRINEAVLEKVLGDLRINYATPLGQSDYDLLKVIYDQLSPPSAEDARFRTLLQGLYILEYRNAVRWHDLNPLVTDLLVQNGTIPAE
jgi:energy-coupling factor transporter ATP-binding protein EcfA2